MPLVRALLTFTLSILALSLPITAIATPYTETVPNGNGAIPNTYPPVGGTMFVLIGTNGNIYYQFVNPSTQFEGFQGSGAPAAFQGIPTFQLGPTQSLNCGIVSCTDYFGGAIAEGYVRITARDGDTCPGNFDFDDISLEINGLTVSSFSGLPANSVERTNLTGTTSVGFEDCFRNQGTTETSTAWIDLPANVRADILSMGGTTPFITDDDGPGLCGSCDNGDNFWFFTDGNDATGTPEVAPGILIDKTADVPSYSAVGDVINYSFEVTNIGTVTLNNIVVTDSFITGAVSCPQTSLTAFTNNVMTCTGQHIVTQDNIDDDDIFVNQAEVTANPTEGALGDVSGTLTIPGPPANNSMTFTKAASPTSDLVVGDDVEYTYVATNTGNITLEVDVTDVHSGSGTLSNIFVQGTSDTSIDIAPGDSATFIATYTITQADFDAGADITNTATANVTPRRGTLTVPPASASVSLGEVTPEANFSKLATPDSGLTEGDTVTYTYSVENIGDVTLTNLSISDAHGGSGPLNITPSTIASLAPDDTATFTADYIITTADFAADAPIINTATLNVTPASGTLAPLQATQTITLISPNPSATLVKTASPTGPASLDDDITYTYVVENDGDVLLSNVTIADTHSGSGTLSNIVVQGTSNTSIDLAPNATATFEATYTVTQADIDAGVPITNTATANASPAGGTYTPPTDNASVTVDAPNPVLEINKTASTPGPVSVGDVITYLYEVSNDGNVTLTNASVSDTHSGSGVLSSIVVQGTSNTSIDLDPGQSATFEASYAVTQADIDAGVDIENTATASGQDPAANTVSSPGSDVSVSLETPNPSFSLTKTPSVSTDLALGDVVIYTYTCLLYTSPSPRDQRGSRMPSSA